MAFLRKLMTVAAVATGITLAGVGGVASAAPATDSVQAPAWVPAPNCITFDQFQHGNVITGYHTNVYLHSKCASTYRVKIVMRNGFDSGCLVIRPNTVDYAFKSNSDDGLKPYVDHLEQC
jgi:hypothetical protein